MEGKKPGVSENSILYEIVSFSWQGQGEDFITVIGEKAANLLGICRLALIEGDQEQQICSGSWGFTGEEEIWASIKNPGKGAFLYPLHKEIAGFLYLEQPDDLSEADKRLYAAFACRIEDILRGEKKLRALQERGEENYRILVERVDDGVAIIQDFRLAYVNLHLAKMVGRKREDLLGTPFAVYVHPGDVTLLLDRFKRRMAGEKVPSLYETVLLHKTGREVKVEINAGIIFHQGGPANLVLVRDVGKRRHTEEALRTSEERYKEILATIEEGYYETDLAGNFVFFNDSLCRIMGYTAAKLQGLSYKKLVKDPAKIFRAFNQVFRTGKAEKNLIMEVESADNREIITEISVSPIKDKNGQVTSFRGIARDVTERKIYEEKLKYLSLYDPVTDIYNRRYFEEEMRRLEGGREYPVSIISADIDDLKLVNDTLGHAAGDDLLKACAAILKKTVREKDVLARVGGDEFAVILPRTSFKEAQAIIRRIISNVTIHQETHTALPLSISLGTAVSESAAHPLTHVLKEADDNMYRDKLSRSSASGGTVVSTLIKTLNERDFITGGHTERLSKMSRKLGETIGLLPKQLNNLILLSHMHDLGKVGIPDRILFKPGKLTEKEWQEMKRHPEIGQRIAKSSSELQHIANLILLHHEHWNGNGYPLGLQGEKIPVECRLLTVIDAYDAMTNERPYRKAVSPEKALQEIIRCAGTQFDPMIAKVFTETFKR